MVDVPEAVSKRRPKPVRRGVARRAGGWDNSDDRRIGREVIRYCPAQGCCALPRSSVATVAICRRRSGTGVAKVAGHGGVKAGQGEGGSVVVKGRPKP